MAAISAREFNQYTGRAKTIAQREPVFIAERGTVKQEEAKRLVALGESLPELNTPLRNR